MTTRNLVPRADNEGKLGTSSKKWADVNATNGAFSTLKVSSLKLNAVADLDLFTPIQVIKFYLIQIELL